MHSASSFENSIDWNEANKKVIQRIYPKSHFIIVGQPTCAQPENSTNALAAAAVNFLRSNPNIIRIGSCFAVYEPKHLQGLVKAGVQQAFILVLSADIVDFNPPPNLASRLHLFGYGDTSKIKSKLFRENINKVLCSKGKAPSVSETSSFVQPNHTYEELFTHQINSHNALPPPHIDEQNEYRSNQNQNSRDHPNSDFSKEGKLKEMGLGGGYSSYVAPNGIVIRDHDSNTNTTQTDTSESLNYDSEAEFQKALALSRQTAIPSLPDEDAQLRAALEQSKITTKYVDPELEKVLELSKQQTVADSELEAAIAASKALFETSSKQNTPDAELLKAIELSKQQTGVPPIQNDPDADFLKALELSKQTLYQHSVEASSIESTNEDLLQVALESDLEENKPLAKS